MSGSRSKESRPSPIPLSKDSIKKLLPYIPYILIGYLTDRLSWLYRHARGDPTHKLITVLTHPELAFKSPFPSFNVADVFIGIIAGTALYATVVYRRNHRKNYKHGHEYGSARWGNSKDIEPFIDPVFRNNIPLTATERLMCSFPSGISGNFKKPDKPKYGRNKNVTIVGGSGSGKTRFYVKPSIMQMHSSFVVTDPKGTIFRVQNKVCKSLLRPLLCTLFIIHQAKEAQ